MCKAILRLLCMRLKLVTHVFLLAFLLTQISPFPKKIKGYHAKASTCNREEDKKEMKVSCEGVRPFDILKREERIRQTKGKRQKVKQKNREKREKGKEKKKREKKKRVKNFKVESVKFFLVFLIFLFISLSCVKVIM